MSARPIILRCVLSPGDVCTLTAAVESLDTAYPGQYLTDVRTACDALFEHNPHITPLPDDAAETLDLHYTDSINASDHLPVPFLAGYCRDLGRRLGMPLELTTNRPHLYLSTDERNCINQVQQHATGGRAIKFWLVNAGVKRDVTLKQWPVEYYQEVIDALRGRLQFVQVGAAEHDHPTPRGVINFVGQTDSRQLIRDVKPGRGRF